MPARMYQAVYPVVLELELGGSHCLLSLPAEDRVLQVCIP